MVFRIGTTLACASRITRDGAYTPGGGEGRQPSRAATTAAVGGSLRPSESTPACRAVKVAGCQQRVISSVAICATRSSSHPMRVVASTTSPVVCSMAAPMRSGTVD
jgi:hypothetical protein